MLIRIFKISALTALLCFLPLLFILAQNLYWSDSEMWAVTVARDLFSNTNSYTFGLKPLFYFPLWLSFNISKILHIWPMETARALFFINALLAATFMAFIVKEKYRGSAQKFLITLISLLVLASSSLYIERSFNVRSDILAITLLLLSACLLQRRSTNFILAVLPMALTPFISLNSVFFWPLLIPFIQFKLTRRALIYSSLGSVIIIIMLILSASLSTSWSFFMGSLSENETGISYFALKRFEHVGRWITKDIHLFLLVLIKVVHDIFKFKKLTPVEARRSYIKNEFSGYWLLLLIIFHPNRTPFFLASLLPFLIIWGIHLPGLKTIFQRIQGTHRALLLFLGLIMAFVHSGLHAIKLNRAHTNTEQKIAMEKIHQLVPDNKVKIYDPVGLLPWRDTYLWYLGPGQTKENTVIADVIKNARPLVIFRTQRFDWISDLIQEELKAYEQVSEDVFLRHSIMNYAGNHELTNEDIARQIVLTYENLLDETWLFTIHFYGADGDYVNPKLINFEGNTLSHFAPMRLDNLIYIQKFIADDPIFRVEIIPTPDSKWRSIPPLKELFRFDAHL